MKKTLNIFATLALVGTLAFAGSALAATQGTLGTTSTGTADVTLTIAEQFRISDMTDFAFGTYGGTGDLDADDNLCVYHNGDGSYRVTITDNNTITPAAFAVENAGNTQAIAMSVFFNDETGTTGEASVTDGSALTPLSGANTVASDCSSGGLSANLHVVLAEAALQAAPAGVYDSTLTLVVEAD